MLEASEKSSKYSLRVLSLKPNPIVDLVFLFINGFYIQKREKRKKEKIEKHKKEVITLNIDMMIDGFRNYVLASFTVVLPILIACLIVAVVFGIVQSIMQIQEQTLSFFPKLIVLMMILFIGAHWMVESVADAIVQFFDLIPTLL